MYGVTFGGGGSWGFKKHSLTKTVPTQGNKKYFS